ncbi:hypothetical protein SJI19_19490 [Acerihabitans sp. TG2]|uniref:hypothetical protein n=1 Tax=Acerihabitans sp. TG2 TaxID=3096008 RepID=UPI002B238844|nr:hypothetical protein [Acerihabitans sp. TG2]MEA9392692.1 hypothetical protein [Acerihabitans sp. TG2]
MTFLSKNNRIPYAILVLMIVVFFAAWTYLFRHGLTPTNWTSFRLGICVGSVFLLLTLLKAGNENFEVITIILMFIFIWALGMILGIGYTFITWHVPTIDDDGFVMILGMHGMAPFMVFFLAAARGQ